MKLQLLFSVLLPCFLLMPISVKAQTGPADFFYSAGGLDSGLVVNGDLDLTVTLGDSVSIYGFWSTNGPADSNLDTGAGLDLVTSVDGIIEFNAAETLDFDIVLASAPEVVLGQRWGQGGGGFAGPAGSVTANSIDSLNGFSVTNEGILESNSGPIFLDAGYDAAGDAFLFSRIDFTAVELGTVDIFTSVGSIGIVSDGSTVPATFGGATINVVNVPEPNSAMLIGSMLAMFGCARRRKATC